MKDKKEKTKERNIEETFKSFSDEEIRKTMKEQNMTYYTARNFLEKQANGNPPNGYSTWGDFWKSY